MARDFRRSGDRYVCRLRPYEVTLLRETVEDVQRFFSADVPPNPISERLFPDPSFDRAVSDELRELIEDDLRSGKQEAARTLLASLPDDGRVSLTAEEAEAWLTALNDVRLALGTAVGITEEWAGDEEDVRAQVYHWVSVLQEGLVEALATG
ncbi:MAG TPA: DUF2017 family protein [Mycobacteriales bacterium]|nr:DUF2017 family protein [Mycobacteriales bacterium]